jgi:hypothetical protein
VPSSITHEISMTHDLLRPDEHDHRHEHADLEGAKNANHQHDVRERACAGTQGAAGYRACPEVTRRSREDDSGDQREADTRHGEDH